MPDPLDDPELEAELARALDPYLALLTPELEGEVEEILSDALTTHPVGSLLLRHLRATLHVAAHGEVDSEAAPHDDDEAG